MKKQIHFIVNPNSGSGNNRIDEALVLDYLDAERYQVHMAYSKSLEHVRELTLKAIHDQADIVVACGGDGTINQVATCLVGSTIVLGIIPLGSGNGLASTLKIPRSIPESLDLLQREYVVQMDVGQVNGRYFFSNLGLGFDADVIRYYHQSPKGRITSYIKAFTRAMLRKGQEDFEIILDDGSRYKNPFLLFVSNSRELGHRVSLTPKASVQDGFLDVVLVPRLRRFEVFGFVLLALIRKHHHFFGTRLFQSQDIALDLVASQKRNLQADGELFHTDTEKINITLTSFGINVIANWSRPC